MNGRACAASGGALERLDLLQQQRLGVGSAEPTAPSAESVNTVDGAGSWPNEPLRSLNAYVAPLALAKRAMAID